MHKSRQFQKSQIGMVLCESNSNSEIPFACFTILKLQIADSKVGNKVGVQFLGSVWLTSLQKSQPEY